MYTKVTVNIDKDLIAKRTPQADHALAALAAKDTEPFVPMLNGVLLKGTKVIENKIIYPPPYSQYLYHGKVMVDREMGKGTMAITDAGGAVSLRFKKGSKLKATDRNLVLTTAFHPDAQDHWFEVSKALNLGKWLTKYKEELTGGD